MGPMRRVIHQAFKRPERFRVSICSGALSISLDFAGFHWAKRFLRAGDTGDIMQKHAYIAESFNVGLGYLVRSAGALTPV